MLVFCPQQIFHLNKPNQPNTNLLFQVSNCGFIVTRILG
uniref:Uncharacterized protein n=1 Tax=Rhizophora mucronata TaxID=61149 RepID=A0A2P2NAC3_RHIMU